MINAKELRIGNIVNYYIDKTWKQGTIECINKTTCTVNSHTVKHRNIEPIPLTEEWLLKLGCKKHIHDAGYNMGGDIDEKCIEYSIGKLTIMDWGNGFTLSNAFSHGLRVDLKQVHQLQNLYFALTNTELVIK